MPHQYRILMMPEAADDLVRIFDHIEQDSPQHAPAVIEGDR